jgi:dihydrolipoamide dehydrogenase
MAANAYDCVVIGSGPGGYVAAIRAAQLGMKTAVIEKAAVGGRCLNEACIPAKAVLRVADAYKEVNEAESFGITTSGVELDFTGVMRHRDKVVKTLTGGVAMLFEKNGIDYIEGQGSVTDDANVKVGGSFDGTEIEAGAVILACGSVPLPVAGLQFGGRILDTAATWLTTELPERLAVIGAGASGTEVASAFGRLGSDVILLEALDQILPLEDREIAQACSREIAKQNVKVVTGASVESVGDTDDAVRIEVGGEAHEVDMVCIAAGRAADVDGLGLDEAGVETNERGMVEVDGAMRTSREGVYAIGDLVRGPALAHKASEEGVIAAEAAASMDTHPIDYLSVPRVTFCFPQVASVGLTEQQAREAGHDVVVGKVPMGAVGAPTVYGDRGGMVKIVGDRRYGELVGGHIVSVKAADLVEELVVARDLEGGYPELARTIHPHPAFAEAVLEAARAADGWLIHG